VDRHDWRLRTLADRLPRACTSRGAGLAALVIAWIVMALDPRVGLPLRVV
jgi:hypothetical protein